MQPNWLRRSSLLENLRVLYYKPHTWLPALRLEMPRGVAENDHRLATVLYGIKHQCATPSMLEPYPLYMAIDSSKRWRVRFPLSGMSQHSASPKIIPVMSEKYFLQCTDSAARVDDDRKKRKQKRRVHFGCGRIDYWFAVVNL